MNSRAGDKKKNSGSAANAAGRDAGVLSTGDAPRGRFAMMLMVAGLVALTLTAYWSVSRNGFVHYDDDKYVTDNYRVQQGLSWEGVKWAFLNSYEYNWHPLTWISHMADVSMFGGWAGGHHIVNLLLHLLNVLLLFWFLAYATGRRWASGFVAAFFALHPLHVQSVAWVAERKDVLSTFFWFAAMLAYAFYTARPCWRRYGGVIALYILGLMSKPMLVTLPVVLLLLDYWPLERFDMMPDARRSKGRQAGAKSSGASLAVEKLPLFVLAVLMSAVTIVVQAHAMPNSARVDIWMRMTNALVSYWRYIWQMICPMNLAAFYPYPSSPMYWQAGLAAGALLGVTVAVFVYGRKQKYLLTGWLWYVVTLIPVAGFIQVGEQSHADRYTYVPLVGLFIIIAWAVGHLAQERGIRKSLAAAAAAFVLLLSWGVTRDAVKYWKDDLSLFGRAVAVTKDNHWMLMNYGASLINAGDLDKAQSVLQEALRLRPQNANALCNMGMVLYKKEQLAQSLDYFVAAAKVMPGMRAAHLNAGEALARMDRFAEARGYLQRAIELDQFDAQAYVLLGGVLHKLGRSNEGIVALRRAVELVPGAGAPHYSLGLVLADIGRRDEAIEELKKSLVLEPGNAAAQESLTKLAGGDK
jgi:protein O-mannosyl-transferase